MVLTGIICGSACILAATAAALGRRVEANTTRMFDTGKTPAPKNFVNYA
jgi:hypothetical protein